jgi:CubicO group peptidase (beta-lactamase class C family)
VRVRERADLGGAIVVGLRDGTAAEAGLSAARLDRVRALADEWVKEDKHPAVVMLVARRGVVALQEGYGRLGPEPDCPRVTGDAMLHVASLTKPITATAVMMLVEDGSVGLTRPVCEYVPEFAGGGKEAVCVHHLLTHTSGLDEPTLGTDDFARLFTGGSESSDADPALHPHVAGLLQVAYERPLHTQPGQEMNYTSLNYELLGEIVRRVSGRALAEFFQARIFDPLGMVDSHLGKPEGPSERIVRAHAEGLLAFIWNTPIEAPFASAGVYSTARDMALFAQLFLDRGRGPHGQLLAPATVQSMITNQIPGVPGTIAIFERHDEASWGYGWGIASHEKWSGFPTHPPHSFSHSGGTGAYLWAEPSADLVGMFFAPLARQRPSGLPWFQADLFVNAVTAAIEA